MTRQKAARFVRRYRPTTVIAGLLWVLIVGAYITNNELRAQQQGEDIQRITRTIDCQVSADCRQFIKTVVKRQAQLAASEQRKEERARNEQPDTGVPSQAPSSGASPGGGSGDSGSPGDGGGSPPGGTDPGGSDPGGGGTDPGGGGTDPGGGGTDPGGGGTDPGTADQGVGADVCVGSTCVGVGVQGQGLPNLNPQLQIPLGPAGNLLPNH